MDIETRAPRYLAILGGVAPADARHLASLGEATPAQRFASGLHSVGVGLYGPVVAEDHLEAARENNLKELFSKMKDEG